jgi:FtsZ-binding cell division protein ZapB
MTSLEIKIQELKDTIRTAHGEIEDLENEIDSIRYEIRRNEEKLQPLLNQHRNLIADYRPPRALSYPGPCGHHGYLVDGCQIEIDWEAPDLEDYSGSALINAWDPTATLILHRHPIEAPDLPAVLREVYELLNLHWPPAATLQTAVLF